MAYEGLTTRGKDGQPRWNNEIMLVPHMLRKPLSWKQPRRIFVNSMSDLFHEKVPLRLYPASLRCHAASKLARVPNLTKRAKRLADLAPQLEWAPNIWMGVSVEDYTVIDRIDHLRAVDAAIRFLSLEPLIGRMPLLNLEGIDWVIIGGESGPRARLMDVRWALDLRVQCMRAGVPCFMKQMGSHWAKHTRSKDSKGGIFNEFPEATAGQGVSAIVFESGANNADGNSSML